MYKCYCYSQIYKTIHVLVLSLDECFRSALVLYVKYVCVCVCVCVRARARARVRVRVRVRVRARVCVHMFMLECLRAHVC